METNYNKGTTPSPAPEKTEPRQEYNDRGGRLLGGFIVITIGSVLLASRMGVEFPSWLFNWYMIPIVIGLYIGARHSFRHNGWIFPVLIGTGFLIADIAEVEHLSRYFWPVVIIVVGIFIIIKPRNRGRFRRRQGYGRWEEHAGIPAVNEGTDRLDNVTVFGGVKKNIISKTFKGGESVTFFGGTELNLMQADTEGPISLELVQVFGGTKLIVPPHWKVQTEEMVSVFGGVDDKRPLPAAGAADSGKVLILKGTNVFGGIDIKSY